VPTLRVLGRRWNHDCWLVTEDIDEPPLVGRIVDVEMGRYGTASMPIYLTGFPWEGWVTRAESNSVSQNQAPYLASIVARAPRAAPVEPVVCSCGSVWSSEWVRGHSCDRCTNYGGF
jgi:hypothetical protein